MLDFFLKAIFLSQLATTPNFDVNFNFNETSKPAPMATLETKTIPELSLISAAVMDLASGRVLYTKDANKPLPIASLTKIMTAIVVLENTPDLDSWMMIPEEALNTPGNKVWFFQYEKLKIRDVLAGALIESGNDAAQALAIQTAGSEDEFVKMMNNKAKQLNLKNTHFMNPEGFDDDWHFSTANDLLRLTEYALRKPIFRELVGTSSLGIWSWNGFKRELNTTDKLLTDNEPGDVFGVKTGTTEKAGQCLVTLRRNEKGHEILAVVLNASDRWAQMKVLTDWVWAQGRWE
ncbi:MAG: serine hydrolase [Patescibacteria group bacterium]|nr:serine hydrolase [Patescibacteria group bacterium]